MVKASRVVVGTTATPISEAVSGVAVDVMMKNRTGTESVFLGGPGVTTADGYEWQTTDGPIGVDVPLGKLYGIVGTSPQTVHVIGVSK